MKLPPRRDGKRSGARLAKWLQNQVQHFAACRGRFNATAAAGQPSEASLLRLDVGTGYQYWYGLPTLYTITRYNHSTHYAMAVWQLGQAVALARVQ
ncbi:lytic murein transglycosylase [Escherichia coli]